MDLASSEFTGRVRLSDGGEWTAVGSDPPKPPASFCCEMDDVGRLSSQSGLSWSSRPRAPLFLAASLSLCRDSASVHGGWVQSTPNVVEWPPLPLMEDGIRLM